jgi:hypothetical protein
MRTLLLVSLFVSCVGCGHSPQVNIPADFQPQVTAFIQASQSVAEPNDPPLVITDLIIQYSNGVNVLTQSEDGECDLNPNQTPMIKIDQESWSIMDDIGKETLMFHELGHCLLFRKHNPTNNVGGYPESIMMASPIQIETAFEPYYTAHRAEYLQELFLKGDGPQ